MKLKKVNNSIWAQLSDMHSESGNHLIYNFVNVAHQWCKYGNKYIILSLILENWVIPNCILQNRRNAISNKFYIIPLPAGWPSCTTASIRNAYCDEKRTYWNGGLFWKGHSCAGFRWKMQILISYGLKCIAYRNYDSTTHGSILYWFLPTSSHDSVPCEG